MPHIFCEELKLIDTNLVVKQQPNGHDVISFCAKYFCVYFFYQMKCTIYKLLSIARADLFAVSINWIIVRLNEINWPIEPFKSMKSIFKRSTNILQWVEWMFEQWCKWQFKNSSYCFGKCDRILYHFFSHVQKYEMPFWDSFSYTELFRQMWN